MQSISQLVEGLRSIQEPLFTVPEVYRYVKENPVDPDSLEPYLLFLNSHYTRNLVYRCDLFELMVICWETGQRSRIHNHQGQNCWMAVPIGRLLVQNYELIDLDKANGYCVLRESDQVLLDHANPSFVSPSQPIHAVSNPIEFHQRAASLHLYSRPYDRCTIYSPERNSCGEVLLNFDTEYGRKAAGPQWSLSRECTFRPFGNCAKTQLH